MKVKGLGIQDKYNSNDIKWCTSLESTQISCLRFWPDEHSKVTDYGVLKVSNVDTTRKDAGYDVTNLEVFDRRKVWNIFMLLRLY